ncbi:MAG: hypothetical protein P3W93_008065, partial [Thermus sp.]|nr:hypothetical protein [Thermus sp.]
MRILLTGRAGGRPLTPSALRVLLALQARARLRQPWAGEGDLAQVTGLDRRSVRRALMELWELGLVEASPIGYRVATGDGQPVQASMHPMPHPVHPMHEVPGENPVQEGAEEVPEIREEISLEKRPPHPHPHGPDPLPVGQEEDFTEGQENQAPGASGPRETPREGPPLAAGGQRAFEETSPGHVNPGTRPLQLALKGAGLWRDFYRTFRPTFASSQLFAQYLARLEREALPLGEAFLEALAQTRAGAARGTVRYPAAYLGRLLAERTPRPLSTTSPPPLPVGAEV